MKRILFFLLLCVIARVNCFSWEIYHDLELDGVYYEVRSEDEQTMSVVGFVKDCSQKCVIPEYVKYNDIDYKVVALEGSLILEDGDFFNDSDYRFGYLDAGSGIPESLTLPGSIVYFKDGLFYGCRIKSVYFEEGELTELLSSPFSECYVETIHLPNTLLRIGNGALSSNFYLSDVNIPDNIE